MIIIVNHNDSNTHAGGQPLDAVALVGGGEGVGFLVLTCICIYIYICIIHVYIYI